MRERHQRRIILLFRLICAALALGAGAATAGAQAVRQPAVAGQFYPADGRELARAVDGYLAKAKIEPVGEVVALVSPHAGYMYSGGVAAHAFATLKNRKIDRVVVISPSHLDAFPFAAVFDGKAYATPLGQVPVDQAFVAKLAGIDRLVQASGRGHTTGGGRGEHALEVQLPFLQRVLGEFKLVPVVMGDQSYVTSRALGVALAKHIQGSGTVIVASSDFSHYHPYQEAVSLDKKTLKAIEEWDYLSMSRNFQENVWEACGGGPIIAAMIAAERLGAKQAKVLKYANSGDVVGDRSRVVGYAAVALAKSANPHGAGGPAFSLSQAEKEHLLSIARKSVETAVREREAYELPAPKLEPLTRERGAFVTLKEKGKLRGCIGYVSPSRPLYLTVRDVAALAAVRDERFPPVTVKELSALEYEVSVLSPLRRVTDVNQIRVGQHGLVIKRGLREGLLLPQVPVEQGWDRNTFLEQACRKAGLPEDSWKDEETDIFLFTALVFGDHKETVKVSSQAAGTRKSK